MQVLMDQPTVTAGRSTETYVPRGHWKTQDPLPLFSHYCAPASRTGASPPPPRGQLPSRSPAAASHCQTDWRPSGKAHRRPDSQHLLGNRESVEGVRWKMIPQQAAEPWPVPYYVRSHPHHFPTFNSALNSACVPSFCLH